jgi:hypothetical protein
MLISILASTFFTHPDDGLDVTHFLQFLAFTCGAVHLFGGFTLHIIPPPEDLPDVDLEDSEGSTEGDERTAFLPRKRNHATEVEADVTPVYTVEDGSAMGLFKDYSFWALVFVMFVILGSVSLLYPCHWVVLISRLARVKR